MRNEPTLNGRNLIKNDLHVNENCITQYGNACSPFLCECIYLFSPHARNVLFNITQVILPFLTGHILNSTDSIRSHSVEKVIAFIRKIRVTYSILTVAID